MTVTVFFSWQIDRPDGGERQFIERALNDALGRIMADAAVVAAVREERIEVDRDTKGVPGTPPIVDTIFAKIGRAAIFVPDLTFVCVRADGRPAPNPNVLIEYPTPRPFQIVPMLSLYLPGDHIGVAGNLFDTARHAILSRL